MIKYNFKGKVALVTGSSSGFGKGIAEALCEAGAIVIINSVAGDEELNITYNEFKKKKYKVFPIICDVSRESEVSEMFSVVEKEFGKLDFLINNAGISLNTGIENNEQKTWDKVLEINLMGKMLCIKHAAPLLKKEKNSRIINIASRLAKMPMKNSSAYCCAQAAIVMLTKCAALEFADFGIRVNTISPSTTLTPLAAKKYSQEEIENIKKQIPLGRLGEVKDVVNTVLFLLDEDNDYYTGENFDVNGGILLR